MKLRADKQMEMIGYHMLHPVRWRNQVDEFVFLGTVQNIPILRTLG